MSRQLNKAALFFLAVAACLSLVDARAETRGQAPDFPERAVLSASTILYSQPPDVNGGLFQSSWWDPNGSDWDQYLWDGFILVEGGSINEIRWRGGYDPTKFGSGGPVLDFTIAIYASIPAGTLPDILTPLVEHRTQGSAGETFVGTFGSVNMYDYAFTLPTPFMAAANTKYWLYLRAAQHGLPDWGLAVGTGGDGSHFRCVASGGDKFYQVVAGDATFTLLWSSPSLTVTSKGARDGWVLEASQGSNVGGSSNVAAATLRVGDDAANRQYRAILSFDTAQLPDAAVITSAVLKIKRSGTVKGGDPFMLFGPLLVDIRKGAFGGTAALAAGDFEAPASAARVATFKKAPINGWYQAALNKTGRNKINKTGITQFRLRFETPTDASNSPDFMPFVSGNAATDGPVLVVTYTLP